MNKNRLSPPHKCALEGCNNITRNARCCCEAHRKEWKRREWEKKMEGTRICPCCKEEKPATEFYVQGKDKSWRPRETCQECADSGRYQRMKAQRAAKTMRDQGVLHRLDGYIPATRKEWGKLRLGNPAYPVPGNESIATPVW